MHGHEPRHTKHGTPGTKAQTGRLDSSSIEVNDDGSFEILFAPEKPVGHTGNFVRTLKVVGRPHPTDPSIPAERYANYVSGRQLFNDWAREDAIHFEFRQIDPEVLTPDPYTPSKALPRFNSPLLSVPMKLPRT